MLVVVFVLGVLFVLAVLLMLAVLLVLVVLFVLGVLFVLAEKYESFCEKHTSAAHIAGDSLVHAPDTLNKEMIQSLLGI